MAIEKVTYCYVGLDQALAVYKSKKRSASCREKAFQEIGVKTALGKWSFTEKTALQFVAAALQDENAIRANDLNILPAAVKKLSAKEWTLPAVRSLLAIGKNMVRGHGEYDEFIKEGHFTALEAFNRAKEIVFHVAARLIEKMPAKLLTQDIANDLRLISRSQRRRHWADHFDATNWEETAKALTAFGKRAPKRVLAPLVKAYISEAAAEGSYANYALECADRLQNLQAVKIILNGVKPETGLLKQSAVDKLRFLERQSKSDTLKTEARGLLQIIKAKKLREKRPLIGAKKPRRALAKVP